MGSLPHMSVLESLTQADPAVRVEAIRAVRYRDLSDPKVLSAMLACACDLREAPDAQAGVVDPFDAFFGGTRSAGTVADEAVKRLSATGLPLATSSADALAKALDALPPHRGGPLPEAAVEWLSEARWPEPEAALRRVVPSLQRLDVPLYPLIVQAPEAMWAALCGLATRPWVPRTFNELLNHPPLHDAVVAETLAADLDDALDIDASSALSLLATLMAWAEPAGGELARRWHVVWPWTILLSALDAPDDHEALRAWLAQESPTCPEGTRQRVAETLRHRGPIADFPLAEVLAWLGDDHDLLSVWPVDDAVATVLAGWAQGIVDGDLAGWVAVAQLFRSGRADSVRRTVERALADTDLPVPWEADILASLAQGVPVPAGLGEALVRGVRTAPDDPTPAVAPALALPTADQRALVQCLLELAEAAPERTTSAGRGLQRIARHGVDVEALQPVVDALEDAQLQARHEALLPVVRGV